MVTVQELETIRYAMHSYGLKSVELDKLGRLCYIEYLDMVYEPQLPDNVIKMPHLTTTVSTSEDKSEGKVLYPFEPSEEIDNPELDPDLYADGEVPRFES
jgi:hypothetical protein